MQKFKRIICMILVIVSLVSLLSACGNEEVIGVPTIIPEQQIFADKYERNQDITEFVNYTLDYVAYPEGAFGGDIDPLRLFEKFKIQVDDLGSVTIGTSRLGDVVRFIEAANEKYIKTMTDQVIAERQAAIDKEYEAAKKAAEDKGKTYNKEKKQVKTDDIHFDAPYTYQIVFSDGYNNTYDEYKPTLLVDPAKNPKMMLLVSKYGIPYVTFECCMAYNMYNTRIVQESDWVVNGLSAAYLDEYVPDPYATDQSAQTTPTELPAYVDVDFKNKAAKKNIIMSGDIAFGGEGFTWDSLMLFCNAIGLKENSTEHGYVQSSDSQFTYYTINILADQIQLVDQGNNYIVEYMPYIRLIATFDPLSQVCVDWTIDMYTSTKQISGMVHDRTETKTVNVHEFQVDTNDYEGMRQKIQEWIDEHAAKITINYYALDTQNNKILGVVDSGLLNATDEITINGVRYYALDAKKNEDGSVSGAFISESDREAALAIEDPAKQDEKLWDKAIDMNLDCYGINNKNEMVLTFREDSHIYPSTDGNTYYLASYEISNDGYYKNVKLLDEQAVSTLLVFYAKTYSMDKAEANELTTIFQKENKLSDVKKHVDDKYAEAEAAQKEQQQQQNPGGNQEPAEPAFDFTKLSVNTDKKIEEFKVSGNQTNFMDFNFIESGFTQAKGVGMSSSVLLKDEATYTCFYKDLDKFAYWSYEGDVDAMFEFNSDTISNYDTFEFYNGIKLGMSLDAAKKAMGENLHRYNDMYILKSEKYSLVIESDFFEKEVVAIYMVLN